MNRLNRIHSIYQHLCYTALEALATIRRIGYLIKSSVNEFYFEHGIKLYRFNDGNETLILQVVKKF